jgi:type I restriction enzyme, S subunit
MLDAPAGWKVRRLETFATKVGSGATPRGGQSVYLNSRVSHALIRSQHVHDRQFDRDDIAFIAEEHSRELRNAEVCPGDILLHITGDGVTFARACIVPNDILPACVNQHVSIVRVDPSLCVPGYLLAYLTHPVTKRYIESFNTGGSRRAITKGHIQSFEVPLPPLPGQRRIAGILSAYDELMENSQRRIRLLEAMARAPYREWFVHFRFPGHEKSSSPAGRGGGEGRARLVTSPFGHIPQGWEVKRVPDCVHINPRVTVPRDGEKPFVPMGCLSNNSMLISDIESRAGNSGAKFQNGDTLFARITPRLENDKTGFVQFLPDAQAVGFGSTEFIVLRSRTLTLEFVYLLARSDAFRGVAIKSMSGATGRQRVQEQCFDDFQIVQPPCALLD